MHKEDITKVLEGVGFLKVNNINGSDSIFNLWHDLLPFDSVFSDSYGKEIYIIEEQLEQMFSKEIIATIEDKVRAFIYSRQNNDGIRYNINLILLCPIDKKSQEYKEIVDLERNKYTCRKLFLNSKCSNYEDEMSILPFIPISSYINYDVSELTNLADEINRITFSNEIILNELLAKEPSLKNIENELLKLVKGNGECEDE